MQGPKAISAQEREMPGALQHRLSSATNPRVLNTKSAIEVIYAGRICLRSMRGDIRGSPVAQKALEENQMSGRIARLVAMVVAVTFLSGVSAQLSVMDIAELPISGIVLCCPLRLCYSSLYAVISACFLWGSSGWFEALGLYGPLMLCCWPVALIWAIIQGCVSAFVNLFIGLICGWIVYQMTFCPHITAPVVPPLDRLITIGISHPLLVSAVFPGASGAFVGALFGVVLGAITGLPLCIVGVFPGAVSGALLGAVSGLIVGLGVGHISAWADE